MSFFNTTNRKIETPASLIAGARRCAFSLASDPTSKPRLNVLLEVIRDSKNIELNNLFFEYLKVKYPNIEPISNLLKDKATVTAKAHANNLLRWDIFYVVCIYYLLCSDSAADYVPSLIRYGLVLKLLTQVNFLFDSMNLDEGITNSHKKPFANKCAQLLQKIGLYDEVPQIEVVENMQSKVTTFRIANSQQIRERVVNYAKSFAKSPISPNLLAAYAIEECLGDECVAVFIDLDKNSLEMSVCKRSIPRWTELVRGVENKIKELNGQTNGSDIPLVERQIAGTLLSSYVIQNMVNLCDKITPSASQSNSNQSQSSDQPQPPGY